MQENHMLIGNEKYFYDSPEEIKVQELQEEIEKKEKTKEQLKEDIYYLNFDHEGLKNYLQELKEDIKKYEKLFELKSIVNKKELSKIKNLTEETKKDIEKKNKELEEVREEIEILEQEKERYEK